MGQTNVVGSTSIEGSFFWFVAAHGSFLHYVGVLWYEDFGATISKFAAACIAPSTVLRPLMVPVGNGKSLDSQEEN